MEDQTTATPVGFNDHRGDGRTNEHDLDDPVPAVLISRVPRIAESSLGREQREPIERSMISEPQAR